MSYLKNHSISMLNYIGKSVQRFNRENVIDRVTVEFISMHNTGYNVLSFVGSTKVPLCIIMKWFTILWALKRKIKDVGCVMMSFTYLLESGFPLFKTARCLFYWRLYISSDGKCSTKRVDTNNRRNFRSSRLMIVFIV